MASADRIAGHHCHHGLREAADLDVQVADVQATDAMLGDLVVADVAVVAADALVATGAERFCPRPGEDDRPDVEVVPRSIDGDLGDSIALLVENVLKLPGASPLDGRVELLLGRGLLVADRHVRNYPGRWPTGTPRHEPRQLAGAAGGDLPGPRRGHSGRR